MHKAAFPASNTTGNTERHPTHNMGNTQLMVHGAPCWGCCAVSELTTGLPVGCSVKAKLPSFAGH